MIKKEMTKKFLQDAFAGESMAHMKYLTFAEDAKQKGKNKLAKMWEAIAYAEFVHARNHFKALGNLKSIEENIKSSYDGENFEIEEMYPVYGNAADFQKENEAVKTMHYAIEAEKTHRDMYEAAEKEIKDKEDVGSDSYYVCPVCGYTSKDGAPDKCPVCGVSKEKFVEFK
jgi:rubrerythrin